MGQLDISFVVTSTTGLMEVQDDVFLYCKVNSARIVTLCTYFLTCLHIMSTVIAHSVVLGEGHATQMSRGPRFP
jgi:hypothetical protein